MSIAVSGIAVDDIGSETDAYPLVSGATGPDYPAQPAAGSNGIGIFEIGISPIGDISSFDVWRTVASQYANSPILMGIIQSFLAAADQTENFEIWYDDVWNIATAKDYGLDIWGRIVDVSRVLNISSATYFGFHEASGQTWNTGVSLSGGVWVETDQSQGGSSFNNGVPVTTSYRLETESFRRLIMAKAASNISDCSIPSINRILTALFPGRGNCYCMEGYHGSTYFGFAESKNALTFGQEGFYNGESIPYMVMTYVFQYQPSPVELAIIEQSGALPKPTGIAASVVVLT